VLLERHQKAFLLRELHVVGKEDVSIYSYALSPHLESADLVSATVRFLEADIWKGAGSLDLLLPWGLTSGSKLEDPAGSVYPGDCPEAFAYGMKRHLACRKAVPSAC
jgi:hypothetical protein